MRITLEFTSGTFAGRKVVLQPSTVLQFGRTENADYAVPHDRQMSGVHFAVQCDQDTCRIRDLNSSNGTKVNGESITDAVLYDGDQILAGDTSLVACVEQPAASTSTSSTGRDVPASSPTPSVSAADVSGSVREHDPTRPYRTAFTDEDPHVRREALYAAAWTQQKWLLDHCRKLAAHPTPENADSISLLAILGEPSDGDRILTAAKSTDLGPCRFAFLGAFGHPDGVPLLFPGMEGKDPREAAAAGAAFVKITGENVESDQRAQLPPEDGSEPDEFEQEFLDEVNLPDPQRAQEHWNKVSRDFARGTRWCRGFDLSQGASPALLSQLDMESRWEACLRGRYHGTWKGSLADLETLAQS